MHFDEKAKKTAKKTGNKVLSRTWKFLGNVVGEITQGTIKVAKGELQAHTVVISDGKIFVDGKEITSAVATDVTIENAENINLFVIGDVTVNGDVNDLEADGNVVVAGNVGGNVESRGSIQCGNVGGGYRIAKECSMRKRWWLHRVLDGGHDAKYDAIKAEHGESIARMFDNTPNDPQATISSNATSTQLKL